MLVMPEERKKMIKALVHRFSTDSEGSQGANGLEKAWSADFIENKGEGKIFLLHGYVRLYSIPFRCPSEVYLVL